ncbi:ABC transporter substrate-binding protein [Spirochaeta cellobiosiphila]|uniref:ABC transporter substrate-binding protein n=1 Tax=Spirochaeta cellobiosiphila TaxID=504483 RepID=UPI00040839CD|nr:extracellular solute-binding protein [Spirochaeta cellobiosiphila]
MKKFFSALLLSSISAVLLLGMVSCSKETSGSTGPKELKVMLSEEPSTGDALSEALNRWAEATGNTVNIMVIPYDDQLTKFPLMAKNNDLPDVIATTRLSMLYPDEFLDLSEYFDRALFEQSAIDMINQIWDSDDIYALPQQFTITNVYYNADAFEKAGIAVPTVDNPWTLEDLAKNAKLLQEKGGVKYGMAMDASRARYDNLMYVNGGSLVEKNGAKFSVTVNSPENINTLAEFVEWNNEFMPKAIWAGGTNDNPADYFKNGNVGVYFSGSWNYNTFYTQIKDMNWGVMPSPVGPNGGSSILGGSGLAVPTNAENAELGIEFLKWFYSEDNFQEYLNTDKGLSSMVGITYSPEDPKVKEDYRVLQSEVPKLPNAFVVDESSMWRNYYDNEYRDALKQAVNGDITPKAALDGFALLLSKKSGWALEY